MHVSRLFLCSIWSWSKKALLRPGRMNHFKPVFQAQNLFFNEFVRQRSRANGQHEQHCYPHELAVGVKLGVLVEHKEQRAVVQVNRCEGHGGIAAKGNTKQNEAPK